MITKYPFKVLQLYSQATVPKGFALRRLNFSFSFNCCRFLNFRKKLCVLFIQGFQECKLLFMHICKWFLFERKLKGSRSRLIMSFSYIENHRQAIQLICIKITTLHFFHILIKIVLAKREKQLDDTRFESRIMLLPYLVYLVIASVLAYICPPHTHTHIHKVKAQYLHFRSHAEYFLLSWKIPEEISRRSMLLTSITVTKVSIYYIKHTT